MAETKTIRLDVDTSKGVAGMEKLAKATHDVSASFEEVYGELQPLTTRMGEAEDRLYELANAGQTASQEYQDLLDTVSRYRKVQIQTDLAVDAAATTMSQKLSGALGGVTAGFELSQGVMGAFGSESEQLEKALLKVQSAMAIAQGVQGFREAIPSFQALKTSVVTGFTAMSTASKIFVTTGIMALVGGIIYLATEVKAITRAFEDFTDWLGFTDNAAKRTAKAIEDSNKKIAASNDRMVESNKRRADSTAAMYDHEIKMAEIAGKDTTKLEIEKSQNLAQQARERYNIALEEYNNLKGNNTKAAVERKRELKDRLEAERIFIKAERNAREEARAQDLADRKENSKKLKEQRQQEAEEERKSLEKQVIDAAKNFEQIDLTKLKIQKDSLGTLRGSVNEELMLKQQAAELELKQLEAKAIRAAKIEKNAQSFRVKSVQEGLATIASITELFGKKSEKAAKRAFEVQKAANIASALISTYQNATSAYASQFTPIPTPDSPIRGSIAAGIAVASGLANVAKIAQQQFNAPSTGGGGASVSTGGLNGGTMTPNFNLVGNSGMNQLAQIQQQPIQAYVVSGEVTSAQSLDRNRVKNATL